MSMTGLWIRKLLSLNVSCCRFRPRCVLKFAKWFPPSGVHQRKPQKRFIHSLPFALDDLESKSITTVVTASTFVQSVYHQKTLPPGSLIIPDPYKTYLKSLPNGQTPDTLVVAKESSALRSIFPLVDHQQHVEAIIDPSSQVIAIAEEVCIDLGLIYNPTIILNMQSANGEVDKLLGLAHNVPLRISEITLYVQIHVICSPAYNILLGRPFYILTESVVCNFANTISLALIWISILTGLRHRTFPIVI
jgi:hypothetical protein